jgi:CheY-like chemotaxis protein
VTRRILIVDDSESFRSTASVLLAARGFELLESVPDGEAALAAVAGDCPDGILLDINLPGRDGFAVAAAIAATYPAIRIMLTSSDTEHVPGALLKTCGAAAFVPGQCGHGRAASPARGSWSVGYWGSSAWQPAAGVQAQRGRRAPDRRR